MPATFEQIANGREPWIDVACEAWGVEVRLLRLRGMQLAKMIDAGESLEKDENGKPVDMDAAYEFAVELLAESIVDEEGTLQFGSHDRRHWLSGEVIAVAELAQHAIELNGLGPGDQETVAEKKSD